MGIPRFFRWLTKRYPLVISEVESKEDIPPFDILLIDLNGIIHLSTHGNEIDQEIRTSILLKKDPEELYIKIFQYLDDLVHLISPNKLLFIGIDSVPPYAKITQQRSRRYGTVEHQKDLESMNYTGSDLFDKNAISPGTAFMWELNKRVDLFLKIKVSEDPAYSKIITIYSGLDVPGEGEHKILNYVRNYKLQPDYDPNIRICVYGQDADLIMLTLLMHIPNVAIVRERADNSRFQRLKYRGIVRKRVENRLKWDMLYINVLREYFELEYSLVKDKLGNKFNFERIIDDFVFICFFIGNDFLPNLNTIDIGLGSLDLIIRKYKSLLPEISGYMTENGKINWKNAHQIFVALANDELRILAHISDNEQEFVTKQKGSLLNLNLLNSGKKPSSYAKKKNFLNRLKREDGLHEYIEEVNKKYAREYTLTITNIKPEDIPDSDISESDEEEVSEKSMSNLGIKADEKMKQNLNFFKEFCKTYESDIGKAKKMYYNAKLHIDIETNEGKNYINKLISTYLEGLQWVLYYYYKGCQHWGWTYNYHYAPLASDLGEFVGFESKTEQNTPMEKSLGIDIMNCKNANKNITPFQQLLCILPPKSRNLLPEIYGPLFQSESPISEFYPEVFDIDLNGKKQEYEAIKLIPFVDLQRVINAEKQILENMEKADLIQNSEINNNNNKKINQKELERNKLSFNSFKYQALKIDEPKISLDTSLIQEYNKVHYSPKVEMINEESKLVNETSFISEISPKYTKNDDFPSLFHLQIEGISLEPIYGGKSECERVLLHIVNQKITDKIEDLFESLKSKTLYVGYPFKREAKVVGIFNREKYLYTDERPSKHNSNNVFSRKCSHEDTKFISQQHFDAYKMQGIIFSPLKNCDYIIEFSSLSGITTNTEREYQNQQLLSKYFSRFRPCVIKSMAMFQKDKNNYLNIDNTLLNNQYLFLKGKPCIMLKGNQIGCKGVIDSYTPGRIGIKYMENNTSLIVEAINKEKMFTKASYNSCINLNLNVLNLGTKIPKHVIPYLLESIKVTQKSFNKSKLTYEIGLKLIDSKYMRHIPYHIQYNKASHDWLYDSQVVQILKEYNDKFPMVINYISTAEEIKSTHKKNALILKSKSIFGTSEKGENILINIYKWIMQHPFSQLPMISYKSKIIEKPLLERIRGVNINNNDSKINNNSKNEMKLARKKEFGVFIETYPFKWQPYSKRNIDKFDVGDVVVSTNSLDTNTIPFGSRGIIVAIFQRKILVEFDEQNILCTSYDGLCKKFKGKLVDGGDIINISYQFRIHKNNREKQAETVKSDNNYSQFQPNQSIPQNMMIPPQMGNFPQFMPINSQYQYYIPIPIYNNPGVGTKEFTNPQNNANQNFQSSPQSIPPSKAINQLFSSKP